MNDRTLSS